MLLETHNTEELKQRAIKEGYKLCRHMNSDKLVVYIVDPEDELNCLPYPLKKKETTNV